MNADMKKFETIKRYIMCGDMQPGLFVWKRDNMVLSNHTLITDDLECEPYYQTIRCIRGTYKQFLALYNKIKGM